MPAKNVEKDRELTNVYWVQDFCRKNDDIKITQKLSIEQTVYHSKNAVVPTKDIGSMMDNIEMYATADQIHVYLMMATIYHMAKTNKILRDHINQLSITNKILDRQGKEDKNPTNKNKS